MGAPWRSPSRLLLLALVALLAVLVGFASFVWFRLDPGALARSRDATAARESALAGTSPPGSAPAAAREPATPPLATKDSRDDSAAASSVRPRGEVIGTVRRQRDGALVSEGAVVLTFIDLTEHALDRTRFLDLDADQQLALNDFDEAEIAADGTFRCLLPCPSIVRRAVLRPDLQRSRAAQFLETEQELGALELDTAHPLTLDLRVDDGAAISGVVISANGGFPLRGARVSIPWWSDDWSDWACETDLEGRFRVAGIRREVAAAKSHSEAIVSLAGYVIRRFEVPPAGDDLDVNGLVLPLEEGVIVTIELAPPDELEGDALDDWIAAIKTAAAWLAPLPATRDPGRAPIVGLPWVALPSSPAVVVLREEDQQLLSSGISFEEILPTRDVAFTLRFRDGRLAGPFQADGSVTRPPQRFVIDWPLEDAAAPASAVDLDLRLVDRNGDPLAAHTVAWRNFGPDPRNGRTTTDERGALVWPPLHRGDRVEFRIARFKTVHLIADREVSTDRPIRLVLDPLPSGR